MNNTQPINLESGADHRFLLRLSLTLLIGVVIAGLLTLFMHMLIKFSQHELDESTKANFLDFVRVKREERSERKKTKPQRPETKDTPPAPPTPQAQQDSASDSGLQVSVPTVDTSMNVDVGGIGIGTGDGEYLPIVKVAPAYPLKAAATGKEGSCLVEYTVTTTGATRDVTVVDGFCPKIFMRASIQAAKKFKYKPRVVGGEAIEVPNVRNRFDYTLDKLEDTEQ